MPSQSNEKIENPHKQWFNTRWLLVLRSKIANNRNAVYNEIAPGLLFGAAPNQKTLDTIKKEGKIDIKKMVRGSLLDNDEEEILKPKDETTQVIRLSTFDHSTLNPNTGKHISVGEMRIFVNAVANARDNKNTVYVHCMAGRSRSMEAVISCLYLDPKWLLELIKLDPKWLELTKQSDAKNTALQKKLGDLITHLNDPYGPLPSDIAEYVKLKRPEATKFSKLGADRTGFLGLMTLNEETRKLSENPSFITGMPPDRVKRLAQNIGLMLQAPLDKGFRNEADIKLQKEDFVKMYNAYSKLIPPMNLLEQMLVPIGKKGGTYKENFEALSPSAKARFAILAAKVGMNKVELPPDYGPVICATAALSTDKKPSVGDQIELLREFKYDTVQSIFESVANRIVSGSKLDRYHAGIQLAELYSIAENMKDEKAMEKISELANTKLRETEKKNYTRQQQLHKPLPALPVTPAKLKPPGWVHAKQGPTQQSALSGLIGQHQAPKKPEKTEQQPRANRL